ncbi:nucleoside deaminase [Paenarthrobacter nitroguajacolicus]|uniref:nucleoside deaminase n=1 Tax=Paenarthrobacter nitroguajacolicus TaxID=211146 RepID=UPI001C4C056F
MISTENTGPVTSEKDLDFLRLTITLSHQVKAEGRHPFGAVVVDEHGTVVSSKGNNSMPPEGDPTQHAELRAAAEAFGRLSPDQLSRSTLYSSAEPCAMCAGAVYWTGIGRVVYGLSEESLLGITGDNPENPTLSLPCREVFSRGQLQISVVGPLLEDEAAAPHRDFWQ